MIFYFTGTGNSYYVAQKLAGQMKCELINMAEGREEKHEFHLKEGETVGFVFPVYFFTLNNVVYDFIQNLTITGNGYTFAVVTCGGNIGGTGKLMKAELKKRNIHLDNVFSVKMPDNAVFYYNIHDKTQKEILTSEIESSIKSIGKRIAEEEQGKIASARTAGIFRGIYHLMATTRKFYATDQCIQCGKCVENCPDKAIQMKDDRPVWSKSHCTMCSACINRCPVRAIQYGKGTVKRNRYEHPALQDSLFYKQEK